MSNDEKFKTPTFRSPPYPYVSLSKAIKRADQLYQKASQFLVPKHVLAECWAYKLKSSGLLQTAAALKQFGLLRDEGSGENRRFKLTDDAVRILTDPNENSDKRIAAIKRAALAPGIYKQLWDKYGTASITGSLDSALISYLTFDLKESGAAPFSQSAAKDVISGYRESVTHAGLDTSDIISTIQKEEIDSSTSTDTDLSGNVSATNSEPVSIEVNIGDWIQREKDGVLTFPNAQRVRAIKHHNGEDWIFIEGSDTGIPSYEAKLERKADQKVSSSVTPPKLSEIFEESKPKNQAKNLSENTWVEVFNLVEGPVELTIPKSISSESFEDFEDWLELVTKKMKRRIS